MSLRLPALSLLAAAAFLASTGPSGAVEFALHPLCVQQMMHMGDTHFETDDRSLPSIVCNQHYRKAPVEARGDFYFSEMKPLSKEKRPPFYKYQLVGAHRGITVVNVAEGVGGNGVYSAIGFFMGWPVSDTRDLGDAGTQVTFAGMLEGGDRCNGGFADAKIAESTLSISENLTPYDLFIFRANRTLQREKNRVFYSVGQNDEAEPIPDKLLALEPNRDLDTAPASCIGKATTEYDLNFGTAKLVSVTLTGLNDKNPAWVAKHKYQACFNKVVKAAVPSFPRTLKPEEVRTMSATFEAECLKPSAS